MRFRDKGGNATYDGSMGINGIEHKFSCVDGIIDVVNQDLISAFMKNNAFEMIEDAPVQPVEEKKEEVAIEVEKPKVEIKKAKKKE